MNFFFRVKRELKKKIEKKCEMKNVYINKKKKYIYI